MESGIRRDQGLADAAVLALQVPDLTSTRVRPWSARLLYAYADALLAADRAGEARDAFIRAAESDPDGETDAADRLDELDGIEFIDLDESSGFDDEGDDEDEGGTDKAGSDEADTAVTGTGEADADKRRTLSQPRAGRQSKPDGAPAAAAYVVAASAA